MGGQMGGQKTQKNSHETRGNIQEKRVRRLKIKYRYIDNTV